MTTREVTKMMYSMTGFLKFTGEDVSMFKDSTLPTLDTALWWEDDSIKFKFFEKETVGNQVLHRNTAPPVDSLRSSIVQEVVRRLLHCSLDLGVDTKREILSKFGQKLINSGHSLRSARIMMVQGVVKFLWLVDRSKLPDSNPEHKPLYLDKGYREEERQIAKYQAKMSWFRKKNKVSISETGTGWRQLLKGVWKGANSSQKPVLDEGFSTVLNIPNTKGAALLHELVRCENKLAKLTKYNVKVVEQSGIQLNRLFGRIYTPERCHWQLCPVCSRADGKKKSNCRSANVVYEARCVECQEQAKNGVIESKDVGVYIGETSRTLVERAIEHVEGAERVEVENFISKHWAQRHSELIVQPRMHFKVVRQCKDALTRQITEAIWIECFSNLNSRSEWGKNTVTRLKTDSGWLLERDHDQKKDDEERVLSLKKKIRVSTAVNVGMLGPRAVGESKQTTGITVFFDKRKREDEIGLNSAKRRKDTDIEDDLGCIRTTLKAAQKSVQPDGLDRRRTTLKANISSLADAERAIESARERDDEVVRANMIQSSLPHRVFEVCNSERDAVTSFKAHMVDGCKVESYTESADGSKKYVKLKCLRNSRQAASRKKVSMQRKNKKNEVGGLVKKPTWLDNWLNKGNQRNDQADSGLSLQCNKFTSAPVRRMPESEFNPILNCYRYKEAAMSGQDEARGSNKGGESSDIGEKEQKPPIKEEDKAEKPLAKKKKRMNKKKQQKDQRDKDTSTEEEESRTSTPKKRIPGHDLRAPNRRDGRKKEVLGEKLSSAKKRLDEGVNIELDDDGSFGEEKPPVTEGGESEASRSQIPDFESMDSSILSELRLIMNELSGSSSSMAFDESDPDLTGVLAGLVGDEGHRVSSAFQMSERLKQELISRAEQAGSRALEWNSSQLNKIGGSDTIRSVWRRLK